MHLLEHRLGRFVAVTIVLGIAASISVLATREPRGRIVVTETETEILDVVEFAPGTAMLRAKSLAVLDAVAATLQGNPSITLVEVQAHTSGVGDETANLALTDQRAAAVTSYLLAAGVEPERLTAQGYGDTQPLDHAGSWKNERIAFLILKRSSDELP